MNLLISPIKKTPGWMRIIIGMAAGITVGIFMEEQAVVFKPLGTVFINAIMMMVAPIVFVSLVCGIIAMKDPSKMGRIALKTFAIYFSTMSLSTSIALFFSSFVFKPGKGVLLGNIEKIAERHTPKNFSLLDTIVGMVPSNIFVAFNEANILQVIFFSMIFGLSIVLAGNKAKPVEDLFNGLSVVLFKFVNIVMKFTPVGVFGLMAVVAGTQGFEVISVLLHMVAVIYLCCIIGMVTVYGLGLSINKLNPLTFFKKMFEAQVVAFSTTSSAATLPINLKVAENKLGVKKGIASFVLPLGSTVNMDGLSSYMGVIAIFTANIYGVDLSLSEMTTIVFTCTIAAIGCAGVPSAGLIVLPMVLGSVGLPLEVIGMIAAVHRLIDMVSTAMNITGDSFASILVAKSEGELDMDIYNDSEAISEPNETLHTINHKRISIAQYS